MLQNPMGMNQGGNNSAPGPPQHGRSNSKGGGGKGNQGYGGPQRQGSMGNQGKGGNN
jgi:hypothetical protein